jgi:hypothetical protein
VDTKMDSAVTRLERGERCEHVYGQHSHEAGGRRRLWTQTDDKRSHEAGRVRRPSHTAREITNVKVCHHSE